MWRKRGVQFESFFFLNRNQTTNNGEFQFESQRKQQNDNVWSQQTKHLEKLNLKASGNKQITAFGANTQNKMEKWI